MTDSKSQDARIEQILVEDNLGVSDESLKMFRSYLQENIVIPCELTGIEDFRWEEFYILGPGDKKEYEELKKTRSSYQDVYKFISFDDQIEGMEGLMVKVKRISDRKQFVLPLADMKATDKKSPNYQFLDDYAVWFVNY